MTALHPIDWAFILGYFALVFGIAYWAYLKEKQSQTSTEYFLAGRNLGWWIIGASVFSSNIGSEHLVGLAGSGATDGVAMAHYELHAWCLLVLGWVMVPFYMRSKVFTMPEFLERRFSPDQPHGALGHLAGGLRPDQAGGGHLRRRHRVRAS